MNSAQSFLIVARDKNLSSSHTSSLLKERKIDPIDIDIRSYEKAVGIEDVRNIRKSILLKPFRSKTKAVIIETYEGITIEAQNSLLKILEEPPGNTIIVITAPKKDSFLPTIISRCKIIALQEDKTKLTEVDISKFGDALSILLNGKVGDKLRIAQDIAGDKENVPLWLEKMAVFAENKLVNDSNNLKYLNFLKELQGTCKAIKSTNVSARSALENLFLSF